MFKEVGAKSNVEAKDRNNWRSRIGVLGSPALLYEYSESGSQVFNRLVFYDYKYNCLRGDWLLLFFYGSNELRSIFKPERSVMLQYLCG